MALNGRFQGRQTQFHVELLYGVLFVAGFGYLVFRVDPRVAAFEGGLVVGYLLRIWEKMSIYERILEESISEEAEEQVASEVEQQVAGEVDRHLEDRVEEEVSETVDTELEERLPEEVDDVDELAERRDERDGAATPDTPVVEDDVGELVTEEAGRSRDDS